MTAGEILALVLLGVALALLLHHRWHHSFNLPTSEHASCALAQQQ